MSPPPFRIADLLYKAQHGLCFHCQEPMEYGRHALARETATSWTKEHIYPRCTHRGLMNNIVLAHGACNRQRADRPPTEDEVRRASEIYASLGLVAFEPAGNLEASRAGNERKRLAQKMQTEVTKLGARG